MKTCSAEERALEVERAIWKAVDRGEIILENGIYQSERGDGCHACAVGSAARVLCGTLADEGPHTMRTSLNQKGVMSIFESYMMEVGFEQGKDVDVSLLASYHTALKPPEEECVLWWQDSAFYRLGLRLRARKRP
jgi:hypothetical protein